MSMSVSCAGCGLEYAGARGAAGLFAQPRSLARGRYLRMLTEVPQVPPGRPAPARGRRESRGRRRPDADRVPHRRALLDLLRPPLHHARWSRPSGRARPPTRAAIRRATCSPSCRTTARCRSADRPPWRTVVGGSRTLRRQAGQGAFRGLHGDPRALGAPARRTAGCNSSTTADTAMRYDGVVVATHPDQALAMLADPTPAERRGPRYVSLLREPHPAAHRREHSPDGEGSDGLMELPDVVLR